MSDWMIISLAVLAFILIQQLITAYASKHRLSGFAALTSPSVGSKLGAIETSLQEIQERLAAIEGILQQVE